MGRKRTGGGSVSSLSRYDRKDQETINLVNELLIRNSTTPSIQDVVALRKLSAIRGLVNHGLRSRVWPLLLGIQDQSHDEREYAERRRVPHRDAHVVECDMVRSLWNWTEGWTDKERDEKRAALKRLIDSTIAGNINHLHYYQGLHDVAAVLLFVCGEFPAYRMLSRLASCHLRDCTRASLDAATEALTLLYPILEVADPKLHAYILGMNEPALEAPYFALSWFMTWFSHDIASLDQCARLFDLFISSHPLMPLYVAAVAARSQREAILACGPDAGDQVYSKLKGLNILGPGQLSADELAQQAAALYKQAPPAHLVGKLGRKKLVHSCTLFAYIENGRWQVPETPGVKLRTRKRRPFQLAAAVFVGQSPHSSQQQEKKDDYGLADASSAGAATARMNTHRSQLKIKGLPSALSLQHKNGNSKHSNHSRNSHEDGVLPLQGVAALTAMVFTGLAGAAFLGTTIALTQMQVL